MIELIEYVGKGTIIEDGVKVIRSGNGSGRGIRFGGNCFISSGCCFVLGDLNKNRHSNISIGDCVSINWGCYISGEGGLEIKDKVLIGPNVCILSAGHKYATARRFINRQGISYGKILIERDIWIGAGSVILPGVTLRRGCVIGAGSVVTESVRRFAVVAGNPARVIKFRSLR